MRTLSLGIVTYKKSRTKNHAQKKWGTRGAPIAKYLNESTNLADQTL
jgi:hypothetical protein